MSHAHAGSGRSNTRLTALVSLGTSPGTSQSTSVVRVMRDLR